MPSFLIDAGATLVCLHGGQAHAVAPNSRVRLSGRPAVVQPGPHTIAGCALPASGGGPCLTAHWLTGALRVKVAGMPVLLRDSVAVCSPTGTGLTALVTQVRVRGE
jgi:hypothetical protein